MTVETEKQTRRMPKVGDKVALTIKGPTTLARTFEIGPDATVSFDGVIVADTGDAWVVELKVSISGRDRINVSKTAFAGMVKATP